MLNMESSPVSLRNLSIFLSDFFALIDTIESHFNKSSNRASDTPMKENLENHFVAKVSSLNKD